MPNMERRWAHESGRKGRLDAEGVPNWRRHEKRSAARTKGIDAPKPHKGDGTAYGRLFQREVKSTVGESLAVKKEWLEKLDREATAVGKTPILVVGFETMKAGVDSQWAMVPLGVMNALVDAWMEKQGA